MKKLLIIVPMTLGESRVELELLHMMNEHFGIAANAQGNIFFVHFDANGKISISGEVNYSGGVNYTEGPYVCTISE